MNHRKEQLLAINRLLTIMDELRNQCPWDKKQTLQSLRHLTIEETYELGDAILDNNLEEVKNELGDLLLHIVFYAKIGSETKNFDIGDVANAICDKLIDRHPHIYGDVVVTDEEEVKQIIDQALIQSEQATDFYQYTSKINQHFSIDQRITIVKQLWKMAYADGELASIEEHIIRKIADLLHLRHNEYIETKPRK